MGQTIEATFTPTKPETIMNLVGINDANLRLIEESYDVQVTDTGSEIEVTGEESLVKKIMQIFTALDKVVTRGVTITATDVVSAIKMADKGTLEFFGELYNKILIRDTKGRPVRVKNMGQKRYIEAIQKYDVVFGIGPAGTGKTFLAVVMAIAAFKKGEVSRIILTRPAVEAGESLGFLPGDLQEKIDPYLRPLYDSLYNILGYDNFLRLKEKGIIEVAPLAYMRGRTLDDAFIILDEAQNATNEQMKMFLTRIGFESKAVVTGDITQIDLGRRKSSGLVSVSKILNNIKGINFNYFDSSDVVRHSIVMKIIDAYTKYEDSLVVKK